jgi:putative colanic acid biosynthesis UDP-glucose lipid carrier transferase
MAIHLSQSLTQEDLHLFSKMAHVRKSHILNRLLALFIVVLISPLLAIISLLIKMDSRGPILFKQRRGGMSGNEFAVYKFRTMKVCEDGKIIKQASVNDNRVTRVGAVLRRFSLDELPQLLNVILGEMSLIGPRPHAVAHNEYFKRHIRDYDLRHVVRPGMTGWAQVNGLRGETDTIEKMENRLKYDLNYVRNRTLLLDIKILLMTVVVVFRRENAY